MDGEVTVPFKRFRVGNITAAVWKNESGYTVTLQKSYKSDDEWRNTDTLYHGDLLNAMKVLERAERFLAS